MKTNRMKKALMSVARGDILLKLGVDKLFPYILYVFFLAVLSIWLSYKAEITMQRVEKNKATIENLKIDNVTKTCDIISLTRISTVESMLEAAGSKVKAPQKPAYIIK
jgi:hypothetical protein